MPCLTLLPALREGGVPSYFSAFPPTTRGANGSGSKQTCFVKLSCLKMMSAAINHVRWKTATGLSELCDVCVCVCKHRHVLILEMRRGQGKSWLVFAVIPEVISDEVCV